MAQTYDISIDQGADFIVSFDFSPRDLTGCTARFQARQDFDSKQPVLSGTSPGMLTISGPHLQFHVPASASTAIPFKGEVLDLVYDLEVVWPNSLVERIVQGAMTINREVTR
ncbi:hypothetical protein [Acidovorax sp.]|uniref:hypothetical protein n=1 Tax=Acidovorax sp. TaxID=1872122 RepID=UPI00391F9B9C